MFLFLLKQKFLVFCCLQLLKLERYCTQFHCNTLYMALFIQMVFISHSDHLAKFFQTFTQKSNTDPIKAIFFNVECGCAPLKNLEVSIFTFILQESGRGLKHGEKYNMMFKVRKIVICILVNPYLDLYIIFTM